MYLATGGLKSEETVGIRKTPVVKCLGGFGNWMAKNILSNYAQEAETTTKGNPRISCE